METEIIYIFSKFRSGPKGLYALSKNRHSSSVTLVTSYLIRLGVCIVSSHTDAIHIGAKEIDGSRMTLPR